VQQLAADDDLTRAFCAIARRNVKPLHRATRLVVGKSASIVRLASVRLNLLSGKIGLLSLRAAGHPTLEEPVVALGGFLGSEIFRRSKAMTDLDTGVTSVASIAGVIASACKRTVVVVIVNNDGLTDDLFKTLIATR
jgi:hypothetical protein